MVFNVQRYSIHDGEGLRTLVFMKGCPLRCKWCSNPEGLTKDKALLVINSKCVGCGKCIDICTQSAVTTSDGTLDWNKSLCNECMACTKVCVPGARSVCGKEYTIQELADIVERDSIFYTNGGGVTVGGGEPLMQAEFVSDFLKCIKYDYGFSTAIETSSYSSWDNAKKVFDYVDIFHMDIKHMDDEIHKELTGVSNQLILENIKKVAETYDFSQRSLIIRIPVIPGLNSSEDNIRKTAEFVKELQAAERIELLPYHSYGAVKYQRTKWSGDYTLNELGTNASDELMQQLADIVKSTGVPVKIGG
jgi:pyruvate formate lyase activating enzyme